MLAEQHIPEAFNRVGQIHNRPDCGRWGWTKAVQGSISIYYPANAQFGAGGLITKHLRDFGSDIGAVSIYYPLNAEFEAGGLITNNLRNSGPEVGAISIYYPANAEAGKNG